MSRRSSRRSTIPSYTEIPDKEIENGLTDGDDAGAEEISSNKAGRKAGVKKESGATANVKVGAGTGDKRKATTTKRKGGDTNGAQAANKPAAKRKVKDEDEDEDDEEERVIEKPEKKVAKKRKTKEDKETDTMPLAARTAIATLKKKMYIGAHISSAGGKSPPPSPFSPGNPIGNQPRPQASTTLSPTPCTSAPTPSPFSSSPNANGAARRSPQMRNPNSSLCPKNTPTTPPSTSSRTAPTSSTSVRRTRRRPSRRIRVFSTT
jgi:hypothetical protein